MKVKEKMWEGRGRPRKFQPGEAVEWRLRAPDNLLMELRVCARLGKRSVNDEIIARLLLSLNYQPNSPVIKTAEGERLIALAVKFENWLSSLLDDESFNPDKNTPTYLSTLYKDYIKQINKTDLELFLKEISKYLVVYLLH